MLTSQAQLVHTLGAAGRIGLCRSATPAPELARELQVAFTSGSGHWLLPVFLCTTPDRRQVETIEPLLGAEQNT